jgi:hypothetical protein
MRGREQDFTFDSTQANVLGITHAPTGFRMHLPREVVPPSVVKSAESLLWRDLTNLAVCIDKEGVAARKTLHKQLSQDLSACHTRCHASAKTGIDS